MGGIIINFIIAAKCRVKDVKNGSMYMNFQDGYEINGRKIMKEME